MDKQERERFRVRAKDAHFNGQERVFTHPADSEESLRASLKDHAPNLTVVSVVPYERGLRDELRVARLGVRLSENLDESSLLVIEERLRCCEDLSILLGTECMESLLNVLLRFQRNSGSFKITGNDSDMFSFGFCYGEKPVYGGLIFHRSSKTWGTHT